jgi:hypothetical protein
MLSFITSKRAPEDLEILVDSQGIDELIEYLQGIKRDKDHMHLNIDTELDSYPLPENVFGKVFYAKHVKLQYTPSDDWKE